MRFFVILSPPSTNKFLAPKVYNFSKTIFKLNNFLLSNLDLIKVIPFFLSIWIFLLSNELWNIIVLLFFEDLKI